MLSQNFSSSAMLNEITFSQIKDNFFYGAYGPFRVIMDKSNGFINATKLCTAGGKQFKAWKRNAASLDLIQALERRLALQNSQYPSEDSYLPLQDHRRAYLHPGDLAIIKVLTSQKTEIDNLISGTYCHPSLIPHIACWVSVDFALMTSEIINTYIIQEWRAKLEASELSAVAFLQEVHQRQLALEDARRSAATVQTALEEAQQIAANKQLALQSAEDVVELKKENIEQLQEKVMEKARERIV